MQGSLRLREVSEVSPAKLVASVASIALPLPSLSLVKSDFDCFVSIGNVSSGGEYLVTRVYRAHVGSIPIAKPVVLVNDEVVVGDRNGYVELSIRKVGKYVVRFGVTTDRFEVDRFEQEHYLVTEHAVVTKLSKEPMSGEIDATHVVGGVEIPFKVRVGFEEAEVRNAVMHLDLLVKKVMQTPWPAYIFVRVGKGYYEPIKEVRRRIGGYNGERVTIDVDLPPFKGPINAYVWIAYWDGESYVTMGWEELELVSGYVRSGRFEWPASRFYRNPEWGMRYVFIAEFPVHLYRVSMEYPEVVVPIRLWGIKPSDTTKIIEVPYELYRGVEAPKGKAFFDGRSIPSKGYLRIRV